MQIKVNDVTQQKQLQICAAHIKKSTLNKAEKKKQWHGIKSGWLADLTELEKLKTQEDHLVQWLPLAVLLKSNCDISLVLILFSSAFLFCLVFLHKTWLSCWIMVTTKAAKPLPASNGMPAPSHTRHAHTLIAGWSMAVVMDAACWCTHCPLTCNWMCRAHTLYHDRAIPFTGRRPLNGW